jgi:hypothetical protein
VNLFESLVIILLVLLVAKDNRANKGAIRMLKRLMRKIRKK